ncbi:calcium-dependent phosphotriesterase [Exidia glandulosa HHB12029]|uniref:Calcium-dependent phosphotriesterase n=1 Tax=Exidia glandulosa HHB12029 TaxID=1314781 RepID=A0A165AYK5_EXIGL|nr:calcium-dependent phosphotriesterase [Exidia glandulosa HHB12029]
MGANATSRTDAFQMFNPTNTTAPFFQVFHDDFLDILGPHASIVAIASNPGFAFAHEAPIFDPSTDDLFFASNDGGPLGFSDIDHNNQIGRLSLREAETALAKSGGKPVNVTVTKLNLPDTVQMTNGGTGPVNGNLLLINSGRANLPPSLTLVNMRAPHNTTVLLDNFFGRQFNSLNDVKIHPKTGKIFFTDVTYGFLNHFRPLPAMPNQVYRFDPATSAVRVVADGFDRCNGVAFDQSGKKAYVADTGGSGGFLGNNATEPATIYEFDVDARTDAFLNRRVFAYIDTGVPDGVQLDTAGNVYAGTGEGVQVFNPDGVLLGKFFVGAVSANMVFAGDGRLAILAETNVYLVHLAAKGFSLSGPH